MVFYRLSNFDGHRYCSSRNMFLICHVIMQDHVIKKSGDYKDKSPSR